MMTAANRFGLYSALRACRAIFFRSSLHPRLTVDTIFWKKNRFILFYKFIVTKQMKRSLLDVDVPPVAVGLYPGPWSAGVPWLK